MICISRLSRLGPKTKHKTALAEYLDNDKFLVCIREPVKKKVWKFFYLFFENFLGGTHPKKFKKHGLKWLKMA